MSKKQSKRTVELVGTNIKPELSKATAVKTSQRMIQEVP